MSAPRHAMSVACLACDTEQIIQVVPDKPDLRFACVSCGKMSVRQRQTPVKTIEPIDPAKPYVLSETDKMVLQKLRIEQA